MWCSEHFSLWRLKYSENHAILPEANNDLLEAAVHLENLYSIVAKCYAFFATLTIYCNCSERKPYFQKESLIYGLTGFLRTNKIHSRVVLYSTFLWKVVWFKPVTVKNCKDRETLQKAELIRKFTTLKLPIFYLLLQLLLLLE